MRIVDREPSAGITASINPAIIASRPILPGVPKAFEEAFKDKPIDFLDPTKIVSRGRNRFGNSLHGYRGRGGSRRQSCLSCGGRHSRGYSSNSTCQVNGIPVMRLSSARKLYSDANLLTGKNWTHTEVFIDIENFLILDKPSVYRYICIYIVYIVKMTKNKFGGVSGFEWDQANYEKKTVGS